MTQSKPIPPHIFLMANFAPRLPGHETALAALIASAFPAATTEEGTRAV